MFPDGGNAVLSHVVYHLHELVNPTQPCQPVSCLPKFSLKACCLGKPFAGKSSVLKKLSKSMCKIKCVRVCACMRACVCMHACVRAHMSDLWYIVNNAIVSVFYLHSSQVNYTSSRQVNTEGS